MPCHVSIKGEDRLALSQLVGEVISFAEHDHTLLGIFSPHLVAMLRFVRPGKLMTVSEAAF